MPVAGGKPPEPEPVSVTTAVAGAAATPIWPANRLDKLPPVIVKSCEPVCSMTPRLLLNALALKSRR